MEEKRYNIDLHEVTKAGKITRVVFGLACLAASGWYLFSIMGTEASTGSSWIATVFLSLFGLWMIASGLGYTRRYITVSDEKIILRQEFYRPPVTFTPASLKAVEFKPLTVILHDRSGSVSFRLGTYYPENTAAIMEAVEEFCLHNNIEIKGDRKPETGE